MTVREISVAPLGEYPMLLRRGGRWRNRTDERSIELRPQRLLRTSGSCDCSPPDASRHIVDELCLPTGPAVIRIEEVQAEPGSVGGSLDSPSGSPITRPS